VISDIHQITGHPYQALLSAILLSEWLPSRCRRISNTIKSAIRGSQTLKPTTWRHTSDSYLERVCFVIPCFHIVFGGDSSSVLVVDRDCPGW